MSIEMLVWRSFKVDVNVIVTNKNLDKLSVNKYQTHNRKQTTNSKTTIHPLKITIR